MKVWILFSILDGFASLSSLDNNKSFEIVINFDGRSFVKEWEPLEYTKYIDEKNLPLGDKPSAGPNFPIVSLKAVECLKEVLGENVEILPVYIDGQEFYLINKLEVLDCLDYEKSEIEYFSGEPKRIMEIVKYSFIEQKLKGKNIFRIKEQKKAGPFVTDKFKEAVEKSGLEGFEFREVWGSEK
ncbi:MAG: DUF1629 domain-containing protein [Anaerocolumna sp.]